MVSPDDVTAGPVLLVVDSLEIGGAEQHVVDLALALKRANREVVVATCGRGVLAADLAEAGIEVCVLARRAVKRRLSLYLAWRLGRLIRQRNYLLVHAHLHASLLAIALALLGSRVPLVYTAHSEGHWRGRWDRLLARAAYRRTSHACAVSRPIYRQLLLDGFAPQRLTTIVSAVPEQTRPLACPPPPCWHDQPVVGVVARLQPEKGVAVFLDAVRLVAQKRSDVRFMIVGDGPLREALQAQAMRLDLGCRIHFGGAQRGARAMLTHFDVLAVPSLREGAPLVVLEAMMAGVAVVASAVGGIPDQLQHGREGLLVPEGDAPALAEAILCLLQNPALARRYGKAGQQRVRQRASHDAMVEQILQIYAAISPVRSWPRG